MSLITVSNLTKSFGHRDIFSGLTFGIAKGEERDAGREKFHMEGREAFMLPHRDPVLYYVQRLRDEAHRFAITGMRARRASVRTGGSRLEDIAGVGPKKRALLLQRFGGVRGVAQAGVDDLASVDGISRELAETIFSALH